MVKPRSAVTWEADHGLTDLAILGQVLGKHVSGVSVARSWI